MDQTDEAGGDSADQAPAGPTGWSLRARDVIGSLMTLVTLGLAQPLLDLLGRNAAFLVAHNATSVNVVVLALVLTIGLPLLLAGAVLVLKRVHAGAAATLHAVLLAILGTLFFLVLAQLAGIGEGLPGPAVIAGAVVLGLAVPLLYRTSAGVRRGALFAAVTAPAVAAMFLFMSPASALVFTPPGQAASPVEGKGEASPPIVMVLFDELPVASLLNADGTVDADAFPAFARLAGDSTFFRNTTTVHGQTSDVFPSLVSAKYPVAESLPLLADHPRNLFSLLPREYDMHVEEPLTELCPPRRCPRAAEEGHLRSLVRDIAVVGSHLVLPPDMTGSLPPIDQGWKDFRSAVATVGKANAFRDRFRAVRETNPALIFDDFIKGIEPADGPSLDFLHILVPHSPWRYVPDGREYDRTIERPGLELGRWVDDEWRVAQGYQRHMLQLQLGDRKLGAMLDRLEATGKYDDAVIVVMADHGATFTPLASQRTIAVNTFGEIGAVPLFVKAPGQTEAEVSDRPLEVVDVLPTIFDLIGAEPLEGIDGRSAFDESAPPRTAKTFYGPSGTLTFPSEGDEKWPIVARRARIFRTWDAMPFPFGIAPGPSGQLLGRAIPDSVPDAEGQSATLDAAPTYDDVDLSAPTVPAMITGTFTQSPVTEPRPVLAVGLNGRIAAVTMTEDPGAETSTYRVVVPPDWLTAGDNTVELFRVAQDLTLRRVDLQPLQGLPSPAP